MICQDMSAEPCKFNKEHAVRRDMGNLLSEMPLPLYVHMTLSTQHFML